MSIEESKAFSVQVTAGRSSAGRRAVAAGPLTELAQEGPPRDLPEVAQKPVGRHGLRAGKTEQTEEA